MLSATETRAAESILVAHWGASVTVRAAELIWDRHHIVRLHIADDGGVVLKRQREENFGDRERGFDAELTALEFLNGMETAIAPRLFGADLEAGILLMEDLGPGSSLADSLLAVDRGRAHADLVSYARAMAAMHAWSVSRFHEYAEIRARHARSAEPSTDPDWIAATAKGKERFLALSARLGLPTKGVAEEIDSLGALMGGSGYVGLVHSDLCPDNTHIDRGNCLLIDFETSGWGPIALDVGYLLAPFPSCWCFASLPSEAARPGPPRLP